VRGWAPHFTLFTSILSPSKGERRIFFGLSDPEYRSCQSPDRTCPSTFKRISPLMEELPHPRDVRR